MPMIAGLGSSTELDSPEGEYMMTLRLEYGFFATGGKFMGEKLENVIKSLQHARTMDYSCCCDKLVL